MKLIGSGLVLVFFLASQGIAQKAKIAYPSMAPLAQYLMPRDAEIALARSAAPKSISGDAEILILTKSGFQTGVANPNVAISLPGGISVIVNEQTSSPSGNTGATTVNALHVTGPSIDIVVASAHSDITCA